MEFLPNQSILLSERDKSAQVAGKLWVVSQTGDTLEVGGLPANDGILDIKLSPNFIWDSQIYVSFIEPGGPNEPRVGRDAADTSRVPEGLSVFRAQLNVTSNSASLQNVQVIWRQTPKVVSSPGSGEPGGHMTFTPDGKYLFIAAGDRQELDYDSTTPYDQDGIYLSSLSNTLGKIIRILPDGGIPSDNPFVATSGALPEIWALGLRNPYGLAFDGNGNLWEHENGPEGGDEFNLIQKGANYGWSKVSNGRNYGSPTDDIPDHSPGDGFVAPTITWYTAIAPSGLIFCHNDFGTLFSQWAGDALVGAMKGQKLVRIHVSGTSASIVQDIPMPTRIRDVAQAGDGAIWVIQDYPDGALVRLTPVYGP